MRPNCLFETAVWAKKWRKVGGGLEVYFLSCFGTMSYRGGRGGSGGRGGRKNFGGKNRDFEEGPPERVVGGF